MTGGERYDVVVVGAGLAGLAAARGLAERADAVVAVDVSRRALEVARRDAPAGITWVEGEAPGIVEGATGAEGAEGVDGAFDLVVLSEVGYFLSPAGLEGLVQRVQSCLAPDGVLLLCHWRHRVTGWPLRAEHVHRAFAESALPPALATYRDPDVEIVVHSPPDRWPEHDR